MEKQTLDLDWGELLPGRRRPPPPPPEETEAAAIPVSELSDLDLLEKIERLSKNISAGLADKLPDKGHKLRSLHRQCCDELDRRNLAHIRKDVPHCQKAAQDKNLNTPDCFGVNGSNKTSTGSNSQGKPRGKTDAAFSEELRLISHDKCRTLRENGLQNQEERQPLEKSPQAVGTSSSVFYPKKDKHRFSDCKFSDVGCPKTSPSSQARIKLSRQLSKRRRLSTYRGAKNLEFEEVQHIILLDDEDVQPILPTRGGETSGNWEEYKIYYPSSCDPECVELSHSDLKCLDPESYLTSPIMNFYIQYLQRSSAAMAKRNGGCYIFNTFFYSKLEEAMTCKDRTASFLKLRRWWKGVDIFQKAYILLPIHGESPISVIKILNAPQIDMQDLDRGKEGELGKHIDANNQILKIYSSWWSLGNYQNNRIYIMHFVTEDDITDNSSMHWSLAIICIPAKEDESGLIILHLDSLGLHSSSHIFSIVGSYLKEEWIYINQIAAAPDFPISERIWKNLPRRIEKEKITVPQQKNEYDCGLFVLYFLERFIEEAPVRLKKKDFSMFGRNWFRSEDASGLRNKVRELLIKEFETNLLEGGIDESHALSSASENYEQL